MPDRRTSFLPFDDEEGDEWQHEPVRLHEPTRESHHQFNHDGPRYRPDTGEVIHPCPACESFATQPRHIARRIVGAIGATAGGTSAAITALSGAELGAAMGLPGGPFGVLCGSIAGAIIAGLAGAATGCATGAALGDAIDRQIRNDWVCRSCGSKFSVHMD